MLIACPECGGRYPLDEEQDDIETPNDIVDNCMVVEEAVEYVKTVYRLACATA